MQSPMIRARRRVRGFQFFGSFIAMPGARRSALQLENVIDSCNTVAIETQIKYGICATAIDL